MNDKISCDFNAKFNKLNESNQKYIIAIQQALLFAQSFSQETKNGDIQNQCKKLS